MEKETTKNEYGMKFFKEEVYKDSLKIYLSVLNEQLPRQIILIAVIVVAIIFLFLNLNSIGNFIKKIFEILIPIILGWILSLVVSPFYDGLSKHLSKSSNKFLIKHTKTVATLIIVLLMIVVFLAFGFIILPSLYASITNFTAKAGDYIRTSREFINGIKEKTSSGVTKRILDGALYMFSSVVDSTKNLDLSKYIDTIFNGFYMSIKTILNVFIALIVMIYALNMKDSFDKKVKRVVYALLRKDHAAKIIVEAKFAKNVFSGYLFGMIIDSVIIGIIFFAGSMLLRLPYAPLIGFIMGCTNLIPFFGPFVGGVPSFFIILLDNPMSWKPLAFIGLMIVVQQLDSTIIAPKILGDKTGVDSFWVLFSILLFGGLFGIPGMVVAVPLWAVITRLFNQYIDYRLAEK